MPWDRKRLLGYVETIQLIFVVTDKLSYSQLVTQAYQLGKASIGSVYLERKQPLLEYSVCPFDTFQVYFRHIEDMLEED